MICQTCAADKPEDDFYRQNAGSGRHLHCKECVKARARKYRADNLEYVREYDRNRGQLQHRREANRIRSKSYSHLPRKEWIARNREKRNAHIALNNALRAGKITKPERCEKCNGTYGIHGHHDDYSKPLQVKWLCRFCHGERHRELNEIRRQAQRMAAE